MNKVIYAFLMLLAMSTLAGLLSAIAWALVIGSPNEASFFIPFTVGFLFWWLGTDLYACVKGRLPSLYRLGGE